MKKTKIQLTLVLAGTISFIGALALYSTKAKLGNLELMVAGLVLIAVSFSIVIGFNRLKRQRKGLTVDDELSNRVKLKAASNAFAYSFYLWLFILLFTLDSSIQNEIIIGIGIVGMGLLFLGFWVYYSKKGVMNENSN